ncbi:F0F1 ATP synthase subunit delta [Paenibacillaceae bacterium]|nr:F0F1 ATP synthase subunit delta [Paenibacillaceae bacterium]
MSREAIVAKRYAKALFELAQQHGVAADVEGQLQVVVEVIDGDAYVSKFFASPNIETGKKVALLQKALNGKVSDLLQNTLGLLIERGRLSALGEIYTAYKQVAGDALGQADAVVYTATSLSDEDLAKTAVQFGAITGKKIRAVQVVDPALLGGVQVRIGDRLYDGSLSGKLFRLEKTLKSQAL